MGFIFLDESGDMGFDFKKPRTSKFFVITCLFVDNKGPVEKIVKKIFGSFSRKELRIHSGGLHCYKEKGGYPTEIIKVPERKGDLYNVDLSQ